MTSETQEITSKTVGYSFHVSIEKELRIVTGAKYPDKIVVKASVGGHEETFAEAVGSLKEATETVKTQLEALEIQSKPEVEKGGGENAEEETGD